MTNSTVFNLYLHVEANKYTAYLFPGGHWDLSSRPGLDPSQQRNILQKAIFINLYAHRRTCGIILNSIKRVQGRSYHWGLGGPVPHPPIGIAPPPPPNFWEVITMTIFL